MAAAGARGRARGGERRAVHPRRDRHARGVRDGPPRRRRLRGARAARDQRPRQRRAPRRARRRSAPRRPAGSRRGERRRAELLEEAARREALLAAAAAVRDPERLAALRSTGLLDSAPDPGFDRHVRLAAEVLNAPVALVSLVDEDRQFFKSCLGVAEPWASERETPLSHSFCQHAVAQREPLVVDDAREHPILKDNPAIADMGAIAYAGVPLDRRRRPRARHAVRDRQPPAPVVQPPGRAARRPRGVGRERDRVG